MTGFSGPWTAIFRRTCCLEETGLIIADAWDAEILRVGPETKLAGARRKVMVQKFARHAAIRLQGFRDPGVAAFSDI